MTFAKTLHFVFQIFFLLPLICYLKDFYASHTQIVWCSHLMHILSFFLYILCDKGHNPFLLGSPSWNFAEYATSCERNITFAFIIWSTEKICGRNWCVTAAIMNILIALSYPETQNNRALNLNDDICWCNLKSGLLVYYSK